eukprot:430735_1
MEENKIEHGGLDTEIESKLNDDGLYAFKLKENKIGYICKSTLYRNIKNPDCRMLCRFCGIDTGDGLKATIDDKNKYYDSKQEAFTFFQEYMDWEQFAIVKHWIRNENLNLIAVEVDQNINIKSLQIVCSFFGMDGLSMALYKVKDNDKYYNPMRPEEDVKQQYKWSASPNTSDGMQYRIFAQDITNKGFDKAAHLFWRKRKDSDQ